MRLIVPIRGPPGYAIPFDTVQATVVLEQTVLTGGVTCKAERPQADNKSELMNRCVFHNGDPCFMHSSNYWPDSRHARCHTRDPRIRFRRIDLLEIVARFELSVHRVG